MTSNKYESKFQQILETNFELIENYNSIDSNVPFEYLYDDIVSAFEDYKKINKNSEFSQIVTTALCTSVKYDQNIIDTLSSMTSASSIDDPSNSIQQYFKDVGEVYDRHNNEYDIEFCQENRDKLIEMNLKTVISVAKRYQGLGLSLQELISAGNYGLIVAFDKFDPERSKLKDHIKDSIEHLGDEFTFEKLNDEVKQYFTYGDIKKKFLDKFTPGKTYSKKDVMAWVNKNIFNAKFNSIATMWIRAYILMEIDNYSRLVKKPKSDIYKDKVENGTYKKEITIDIDTPISPKSSNTVADILSGDNIQSDLDSADAYVTFKNMLNKMLEGVKPRDRSIFLKKFGIGLPRPMLPKEIADQEGLSKARVSQIFQSVIEQMQANSVKYDIDSNVLFEAIKNFK